MQSVSVGGGVVHREGRVLSTGRWWGAACYVVGARMDVQFAVRCDGDPGAPEGWLLDGGSCSWSPGGGRPQRAAGDL